MNHAETLIEPEGRHPASFRDRSGFVFQRQGHLYRQVNESYRAHFDQFLASGLYAELVAAGLLVEHREVAEPPAGPQAYKVIAPRRLPVISYPYEWCFSQLKDAALLTLDLQRRALQHGMMLKDASAYNVLFEDAAPVFIDTLSFEIYTAGQPWVAYRQFCQHFLAPLALMSYTDIRLGQLARLYLDGVPLDLAVRLLPRRSFWRLGLLLHLYFHARQQRQHAAARQDRQPAGRISRAGLQGIVENLAGTVRRLHWRPGGTEWADYYARNNNYTDKAADSKIAFVKASLARIGPATVLDLGANTGRFSQVACNGGARVLALDVDPSATEQLYLRLRAERGQGLLPLHVDLINPAGGLGWDHQERLPLLERVGADLVMALALVHHLALTNHVPFEKLAATFARLGPALIVEFVPALDSQAQRLLAGRADKFPDYTAEHFVAAFGLYYDILATCPVAESARTLYLMKKK